ncbi:MAG: hypothetical protein WBD20_10265 [Pirellulaceae bacterium]
MAQGIAAENATTEPSTKLDLILNRLQSIEERLGRIEMQLDSIDNRSGIQNSDRPIECDFIPLPGFAPGQEIMPGQILGHIVPRQSGVIDSPWLKEGATIETIIKMDKRAERK